MATISSSVRSWMGCSTHTAAGVEAEGLALYFGPVDELDGGDEDGRNAAAFQISDVVHTARRATASIG